MSAFGNVTPKASTTASSHRSRALHVNAAVGGNASVDLPPRECLRRMPSKHGSDTESLCTSRLLTTRPSTSGRAIAAPGMKSTSPRTCPSETAYLNESHQSCGSAVVFRPKRKHVCSCCTRSAWVASCTRKRRRVASRPSTPCRRSTSTHGTRRFARRVTAADCPRSAGDRSRHNGTPCSLCVRSATEPRTGKIRSGGAATGGGDGADGGRPPMMASTSRRSASSSQAPRCTHAVHSAER